MSSESNDKFLHVQRRRIEHDKWCEGCGVGYDPGAMYVMNWIKNYAGVYRLAWNQSLCQSCKNYRICGMFVRTECSDYDEFQRQS